MAEVEPGTPLLTTVLRRVLRAVEPSRVMLATTVADADAELASIARASGIAVYRGSIDDVLARFLEAAAVMGWTRIIRVCADNPFLMPDSLVPLVEELERKAVDYVGYRFADGTWSVRSHCGLFAEAADCGGLARCARDPLAISAREHVTAHLYAAASGYSSAALPVPREDVVMNWRLTVDTPADLDVVRTIYADVGFEGSLSIDRVAESIVRHPGLAPMMQATIEGQPK